MPHLANMSIDWTIILAEYVDYGDASNSSTAIATALGWTETRKDVRLQVLLQDPITHMLATGVYVVPIYTADLVFRIVPLESRHDLLHVDGTWHESKKGNIGHPPGVFKLYCCCLSHPPFSA